MYILGISCYYHDAAAVLLKDGALVAAAEEERFTRKKTRLRFSQTGYQILPGRGGHHRPGSRLRRVFREAVPQAGPHPDDGSADLSKVLEGVPRIHDHMDDRQALGRDHFADRTGISKDKILFSEHHLSHAASAYLCSPFEESAVLTVDGVGEWVTATHGMGKGNQLTLNKQIEFPHSLGLLYSAFTAFLGFEVNEGEYKVMGMAPYGDPIYVDKVWKLIQLNSDGSFSLNMDYFSPPFHREDLQQVSLPRCLALRVHRRCCSSRKKPVSEVFRNSAGNFQEMSKMNNTMPTFAASIQKVTEDIMVGMATHLHKTTGMKNLCMAGGVALNSVANTRILKESGFENMYVQPAAGDGGGALGAALWAYNTLLGKPRNFQMDHAFWGVKIRIRKSEIS